MTKQEKKEIEFNKSKGIAIVVIIVIVLILFPTFCRFLFGLRINL